MEQRLLHRYVSIVSILSKAHVHTLYHAPQSVSGLTSIVRSNSIVTFLDTITRKMRYSRSVPRQESKANDIQNR